MSITLIHTSEWQIGSIFRFVDNANMGALQEAHPRPNTRLGQRVGGEGIRHILIAGLGSDDVGSPAQSPGEGGHEVLEGPPIPRSPGQQSTFVGERLVTDVAR